MLPMNSRRSRRKRNKGLVLLILPLLVLIGFIGWCIYTFSRREKHQIQKEVHQKKPIVTFMPIIEERQHIEADTRHK